MRAVTRIEGTAAVLDRADVDTDQIVPAEHLKRIERTGFAECLFSAWREDPAFELNRPESRGASILLVGTNFGCGSSREHAVWALEDAGFRALIGPGFADIFRANCGKVGVVAVELPEATVRALMDAVTVDPAVVLTVDLGSCTVTAPGVEARFEMDGSVRWRLMEGLDDISLTLQAEDLISSFERRRPSWAPSVGP